MMLVLRFSVVTSTRIWEEALRYPVVPVVRWNEGGQY